MACCHALPTGGTNYGEAALLTADIHVVSSWLRLMHGELYRLCALRANADHPGLLYMPVYLQNHIIAASFITAVDDVGQDGDRLASMGLVRVDVEIL